MDEKSTIPAYGSKEPHLPPIPSTNGARRKGASAYITGLTMRGRILYTLCLTLAAWLILHTTLTSYHRCRLPGTRQELSKTETMLAAEKKNVTKVALEAHIMSKCPDAKACLQKLVVPAMVEIADKVDFRLSYIGSIDTDSDAVSCKHGPPECLGNIILLCAAHLYPSPKLSLGFANCMVGSYASIPDRELVETCALEHGLSFGKINDCISDDSAHGVNLLRDSIARSAENNVTTSCTVRLQGEFRCVRDGGKWRDCEAGSGVEDLVGDVKALWDKVNGK